MKPAKITEKIIKMIKARDSKRTLGGFFIFNEVPYFRARVPSPLAGEGKGEGALKTLVTLTSFLSRQGRGSYPFKERNFLSDPS
jgi:hypothetical protein